MEAAVVGNIFIFIIGIIDTLIVSTIVSAMSRPVYKTRRENIPHLKILIQSKVSLVVMTEKNIDLRVGVWFSVSSMECLLKRVYVGRERRH